MSKTLLIILFILTSCAAWTLFNVKGHEYEEYEALLKSSSSVQKKENSSLLFLSQQMRKNVVKELWWGDVDHPFYLRIECGASELTALRQKGEYDAIEKMGNMKSLFQEKLFYKSENGIDKQPMQEVRYFEAKKGAMSYATLDFIGEDVNMKKYRLQGHLVPTLVPLKIDPISQGQGKKMHFSFKDEKIDISLESFQTTFNPKDGI